ncbi:hypothetical protein [Paraburkholderia azotifigens]|uniref:Uncharacterized protein n=1 Tax=Paraburkholderia azotifigens TaxID=2057004 RepID=A0A5C6V285_9BURK|nr:hypothetical protein [Paraburkholderia azotifigens]TXC79124.1 hypothetical protein FRZ40_32415 [Paraburkholderia azotifigens]
MFLKFRVDTDERIVLKRDVETALGFKTQEVLFPDFPKTTNGKSLALVGFETPNDFLDRFPGWRSYIEP